MISSWHDHLRALVFQSLQLSAVHWLVSSSDVDLLGDLSAVGHLCRASQSWRVRRVTIMELSLQKVEVAKTAQRGDRTGRNRESAESSAYQSMDRVELGPRSHGSTLTCHLTSHEGISAIHCYLLLDVTEHFVE
jgi:hypothetical protein